LHDSPKLFHTEHIPCRL